MCPINFVGQCLFLGYVQPVKAKISTFLCSLCKSSCCSIVGLYQVELTFRELVGLHFEGFEWLEHMLSFSVLINIAGAYAVKTPILLHCWGILSNSPYQITLLKHMSRNFLLISIAGAYA